MHFTHVGKILEVALDGCKRHAQRRGDCLHRVLADAVEVFGSRLAAWLEVASE
jgi:hypothetical protein